MGTEVPSEINLAPIAEVRVQRARARVDYAIGVTGIAGPGGGSSEKPVGTVYLSLAGPEDQLWDCRLNLPGERGRVKYQASQAALDMLRRALLE